jgi:hypothetical protein
MQLTRERPRATPRLGLIRRIVLGEPAGGPIGFRERGSDLIDLRTVPGQDHTAERIDRLETGMRMIVETMKRTYGRLAAAIEELGDRTVVGTTIEDVQRAVAESLQPVAASLGEVAETLRGIPYLLAAAAEHVTERVEEARAATEAEAAGATDDLPLPAGGIAVLPVVPFELESVEEEFDTLTAIRRARFAVDEIEAALEDAAS